MGILSDAKEQGHMAEYGSFSNLATFGLWVSTEKWGGWHWGDGFTIGASYIGNYLWSGMVDEVEMSTVSRSAAWI